MPVHPEILHRWHGPLLAFTQLTIREIWEASGDRNRTKDNPRSSATNQTTVSPGYVLGARGRVQTNGKPGRPGAMTRTWSVVFPAPFGQERVTLMAW